MNQLNGTGIDFPSPEQPSTLAAELAALGIYPPLFSLKAEDQTVNNSSTLVDCVDLAVELEANSTYMVSLGLYIAKTAAVATSGIIIAPEGATVNGNWWNVSYTYTLAQSSFNVTSRAPIATYTCSGDGLLPVTFMVRTTSAGTLKFQFAQDSANASNHTIKSGSWIKAQKL